MNENNDNLTPETNGETETPKKSFLERKYTDFNRGTIRLINPDKSDFPIFTKLESSKTFKTKESKRTSSDRIKLLTFELTGTLTEDSQNNLLLIDRFINDNWTNETTDKLLETTLSIGRINFRTTKGKKTSFDLRTKETTPNKETFTLTLKTLLKLDSEGNKD